MSARAIRPFEYGVSPAAEEVALALPPLAHVRASVGEAEQLGVEILAVDRRDVAAGEDDLDPALARRLGDDVDRRGLQLDQEDLRLDARQLGAQLRAVGEAAGDVDDVGAVLLAEVRREALERRLGRGREERDRPALDRLGRLRAQRRRDHPRGQRERAAVQLLPAASGLGHRQDDEVGDQVPVLVQVAGDDLRVLLRVDDEDPAARLHGRERGAAAVEHDELGAELDRQPCARVHVRGRTRSPRARRRSGGSRSSRRRRARPSRGSPRRRGGRRARARAARRRSGATLRDLGLGRAAPPHRDDDDLSVARVEPSGVSGDRRLADPLAGADDPDRRQRERLQLRADRSGSRRRRTASPAASTRLANRKRSRGPSTGSSERSTTSAGLCSASASSRSSTTATP